MVPKVVIDNGRIIEVGKCNNALYFLVNDDHYMASCVITYEESKQIRDKLSELIDDVT